MTTCEIKPRKTNIGRMAAIVLKKDGRCYVGNVMDLVSGTGRPKRIRIQYSVFMQGTVVQPHEYDFKEWADDWDD